MPIGGRVATSRELSKEVWVETSGQIAPIQQERKPQFGKGGKTYGGVGLPKTKAEGLSRVGSDFQSRARANPACEPWTGVGMSQLIQTSARNGQIGRARAGLALCC